MADQKPVHMESLMAHTFAGATYQPGDVFIVAGDGTQTAEQYADTLSYLQHAKRVDAPVTKGPPAYAPVGDDDRQKADKAVRADAAKKTVEHRKPALDVPTVKK